MKATHLFQKSQKIVAWLISSNLNYTRFGNILEQKGLTKGKWREDVGRGIIKFEKISFLSGNFVFSTRVKILPEASSLRGSEVCPNQHSVYSS